MYFSPACFLILSTAPECCSPTPDALVSRIPEHPRDPSFPTVWFTYSSLSDTVIPSICGNRSPVRVRSAIFLCSQFGELRPLHQEGRHCDLGACCTRAPQPPRQLGNRLFSSSPPQRPDGSVAASSHVMILVVGNSYSFASASMIFFFPTRFIGDSVGGCTSGSLPAPASPACVTGHDHCKLSSPDRRCELVAVLGIVLVRIPCVRKIGPSFINPLGSPDSTWFLALQKTKNLLPQRSEPAQDQGFPPRASLSCHFFFLTKHLVVP